MYKDKFFSLGLSQNSRTDWHYVSRKFRVRYETNTVPGCTLHTSGQLLDAMCSSVLCNLAHRV